MNTFLKDGFSEIEFQNAKKALETFVLSIEEIYETELMKFNFHLLLHIPKSVKQFGGLWAVSAFPYEHFNGVLAKMFKNSRSIPLQICKNYLRTFILQEMVSHILTNNNCSSTTKQLFQKFTLQKYSMNNCLKIGNSIRLFGTPHIGTVTLIEKTVIETLLEEEIVNINISFFKRVIYKNILYHIKEFQKMTKRTNSIVQLQNKDFINITKILLVNTAVQNKQVCVL